MMALDPIFDDQSTGEINLLAQKQDLPHERWKAKEWGRLLDTTHSCIGTSNVPKP
jgi:hypothetical protein